MASIRLKFRPSTVKDREGFLNYQIIHKRIVRLLKTPYQIFPEEWNDATDSLIITKDSDRRALLLLIHDKTNWEIRQLHSVVSNLEQSGMDYNADDIIKAFLDLPKIESVFSFMHLQIARLEQENRLRTAKGYVVTLKRFMKFRNGEDLSFEAFDSVLMSLFASHLKESGLVKNSSSFYMRNWKTVYNLAVAKGYTTDKMPFKHVYTGIDKTVKRAIPLNSIKAIKNLDLTFEPKLELARDIFMFSFYTRGMSYIDMAYLTEGNIKYSKLTYARHKTGQRLYIQWEKPMQEIVDKYKSKVVGEYLLPIFQALDSNEISHLSSRFKHINRLLKVIAQRIGLNIPLTLYVARHSWASIAKGKNIPIDVIRDGLGHDSEKTTQIYLASLDTSLVDKANLKIMKSL